MGAFSANLYAVEYSKELIASAQKGNAQAQYELGQLIYHGKGITKDKKAGFAWMLESAEKGYVPAQISVGESYYWGIGTIKDKFKAVEWYQKASAQKSTNAIYLLSQAYIKGSGVQQNIPKGNQLRLQAAELSYVPAMIDLAQAYRTGESESKTAKVLNKSFYWYEKAANTGDRSAMLNLGLMYEEGEGTAQDNTQALKYYLEAAQKGESVAQFNICRFYFDGTHPLKQDYESAFKWCKAAALQDDYYAKLFLGRMYAKGLGVKKDQAMAVKWYKQVHDEEEAAAYIASSKQK